MGPPPMEGDQGGGQSRRPYRGAGEALAEPEGFSENPFPLVSLGYFPFQGQQAPHTPTPLPRRG